MDTIRLGIKPSVYRGRAGFLLYGRGPGLFGTRVWAETRAEAELARENIKAGRMPFAPQPTGTHPSGGTPGTGHTPGTGTG